MHVLPCLQVRVPGAGSSLLLCHHSFSDDSSADTSWASVLTQVLKPAMERRSLLSPPWSPVPTHPSPGLTVSGQGETSQKEQGWLQPLPSLPRVNDDPKDAPPHARARMSFCQLPCPQQQLHATAEPCKSSPPPLWDLSGHVSLCPLGTPVATPRGPPLWPHPTLRHTLPPP